jgi:hypothetical protein
MLPEEGSIADQLAKLDDNPESLTKSDLAAYHDEALDVVRRLRMEELMDRSDRVKRWLGVVHLAIHLTAMEFAQLQDGVMPPGPQQSRVVLHLCHCESCRDMFVVGDEILRDLSKEGL